MKLINLLNEDITQEEYLRFKNACVCFKNLPSKRPGLVVKKNDLNVIIINETLDDNDKKDVFLHELAHLELNHTYKYRIVSDNEQTYEDEVEEYIRNLID